MFERAYLPGGRVGAGLARVEAEVARLMGGFTAAGAVRVDPAALLPAEALLDLYGEDIRARAFVMHDGTGEMMLRPDFTVPVVQRHMALGAEPARYAYAGPVWRRQRAGRRAWAQEYLQCGFELFDGADPAAADAEVFALIAEAVRGRGLRVVVGDLGLLMAAIAGLTTSPTRRAALRRHLWRPARFEVLLERFSRPPGAAIQEKKMPQGKVLGKRTPAEVAARLAHLAEEAQTPALKAREVAMIHDLLALQAPAPVALERLRAMAGAWSALAPGVTRLSQRLSALEAHGIDVADLPFDGAYGRSSMEYYDGFVFGFTAQDSADLPVIASGGRYDALTKVLGGKTGGVPAVGGIIRPEALLALGTEV